MKQRLCEISKFCIVGVTSALIDLIVYNIVLLFTSYFFSVVVGFVVSWIINYFLSSHWTFKEKPTLSNFFAMLSAHLTNLFVVRLGVIYIFVELLNIHPRVAYIPTLVIAAITSYFMVRFCFKHNF